MNITWARLIETPTYVMAQTNETVRALALGLSEEEVSAGLRGQGARGDRQGSG